MPDMHPQPEQHRRDEDQTYAARVAYSPWASLAHLAATAALLVTVIGFGAQFYSTVQSNLDSTIANAEDVAQVDQEAANISSRVTTLEQSVKRNTRDIERVESQASEDRNEIIRRLETLSEGVQEMNRYLRGINGLNDGARSHPMYVEDRMTRADEGLH